MFFNQTDLKMSNHWCVIERSKVASRDLIQIDKIKELTFEYVPFTKRNGSRTIINTTIWFISTNMVLVPIVVVLIIWILSKIENFQVITVLQPYNTTNSYPLMIMQLIT